MQRAIGQTPESRIPRLLSGLERAHYLLRISDSPVIKWDGGISYQGGVNRPGYREELTTWSRAILDDTDCAANLEDGYRDMLVIDAIIESTEGAGEVAVEPVE